MLKLNIKAFVNGLADLPECDKDEPLLGEGYLTECVALPFLCGEYLSLYEIDWDAFDNTRSSVARTMYYRCEAADQLETPVLMLYAPAVSTRPTAGQDIQFI